MTVHAFTSFTFSYLDRARVLARSLRRYHPDWVLWAAITDRPPEDFAFDPAQEPFDRMLWTDELWGDTAESWLFGHDLVEACTAVKGRVLRHLLDQPGCSSVFYFDPDIALFAPVTALERRLGAEGTSILLTPHQTDPEEDRQAIADNEIGSLKHGVFNLGFIAVRNDPTGQRFAHWWAARLQDWCLDDIPGGLFTDQKWANLIPCFFGGVEIVRDPGCNVASWNIGRRRIDIDGSGRILVNGSDLKFYHFTKLGPVGDTMTQRYAGDNLPVYEIWAWYRRAVEAARDAQIPPRWWYFGRFDDGRAIPTAIRRLWRGRRDLRAAFAHPRATGPNSLLAWIERNTDLRAGPKADD